MADDVAQSQLTDKGPSSSSSAVDEQRPKTINVNVDISGDRWVVVSYQDEKGDLFHGMLLKASECHGTEAPASQGLVKDGSSFPDTESWKKSSGREAVSWSSPPGLPQSMLLNGLARSPEWDPNKISAVSLRRTFSNGAAKKEDDFGLANSKPALGIRRLENRSVRLRPTASQRSTVLCAKCQEQRVWLPPGRRSVTNGSMDRITRNGPVSLVYTNSALSTSGKRRFSDAVDPATSLSSSNSHSVKKFKTARNLTSMAAEADQATAAALPAASKVIPSSDGETGSKAGPASESAGAATEKKILLKIPKLKISFGNNEEKTTTIITLPPTHTSSVDDGTNGDVDSNGSSGTTEKSRSIATVSSANGDTFDEREGVLLSGGLRVGDVVWAKMPGSPYWPAKIFSASGNAACVTWCGSRQYGFVEFKAMEPFKEAFRKRYNTKRNTGGYQKAVAEAIVKCSGSDGDPSSPDCYYYQHLISAVCWKYLTGSRNAAAQARSADRNRRRTSGRNNSGASNRRGKASKPNKHSFHAVDGIDSESVTSVSSLNSPTSNSTTPNTSEWQPRVMIRAIDQEAAEKSRRKSRKPTFWNNMAETRFDVKPKMDVAPKPGQSSHFYMDGPVSPLPVQRSEDDDDEDDDFKKLEIDETAQLDDDEEMDGERDQSSSSFTTITTSESFADGSTTYRLVPASPANDKSTRHQPSGAEGNGPPSGVRTGRVGEGQDDFESALTELQEMNELCAGTSVLAQC